MLEWLAVHFLIGVVGTWLARRYALHRSLIDQPGERRSHSVATPRGGGISIVIALLVATVAIGIRQPAQAPLMLVPSLAQHLLIQGLIRGEPLQASWAALAAASCLALGVALAWLAGRLYRREAILG